VVVVEGVVPPGAVGFLAVDEGAGEEVEVGLFFVRGDEADALAGVVEAVVIEVA